MTLNVQPIESWEPLKSGIFRGLSNEKYHDPKTGLSRSIGQEIVFKSPSHGKEAMDNPEEPTKFMTFGTLVHCAVLEPENLLSSYYVRPDCAWNDPEDKWHGNKKWCKAWLQAKMDRPSISAKEEQQVKGCTAALKSNKTMAGMLSVGSAELSCFAFFEGVWVKCRPDLIAYDAQGGLWVLDIKKCQDATYGSFLRESRRLRRDFQQAWYEFVLSLLGLTVSKFVFAAVEENAPHGMALYEIDPKNVTAARPKVIEAIDKYRQCAESGEWPGLPGDIKTLEWRVD